MTSRPKHFPGVMLALVCATAIAAGCANHVRRYPQAEPMWLDAADTTPFLPTPEEYFSPFAWDAADNMLFRPFSRIFAVDPAREALNVNAMDEAPDSSWFTNRWGRGEPPSPERLLRGSCDEHPLEPTGPWTITSAKPNGANPGFIIKDQEGRAFLLKFDGLTQPERATAADVIGSLIYWAAGYYTPCNQIVLFNPDILRIGDDATALERGKKVPLTKDMLKGVFEKASQRQDGRWRAAASRFLPGRPLGPWRYEGTRDDDPNDVIPHEDRRELRGAYVLASWVNHFDAREQNTLSMWIEDASGQGYVRHNYLDFGDSFGSTWSVRGMSERHGHTYYLDMGHLLEDFVTLGTISRPWNSNKMGPAGEVLAYFNVETFDPEDYRTGYPNPAFIRASERDKAWMARIIAEISPATVAAMVREGHFENKLVETELVRILLVRRAKILRRWFRSLSPLTRPTLRATASATASTPVSATASTTELCLRDLAITSEIASRKERSYATHAWQHLGGRRLQEVKVGALHARDTDEICVELPSLPDVSQAHPGYLIVDVIGLRSADDDQSMPARVHLYQRGPSDYRIVGLQRPDSRSRPRRPD